MRDKSMSGMGGPTHEDAALIVQLARWNTDLGVSESLNFLRGGGFDDWQGFRSRHGPGTEGYLHLVKVLQFYETVGTLWKHGLINEELLFDWLGISVTWDRFVSLAHGDREERGVASLWQNFEAMAEAQRAVASRADQSSKRGVAVGAG